jgi:hypothetical protein
VFRGRARKRKPETAYQDSGDAAFDTTSVPRDFLSLPRAAGNRATARLLHDDSGEHASFPIKPSLGVPQDHRLALGRALVGLPKTGGNAAIQRHVARIQRQVKVDPVEMEKYEIRGGKYSAQEKRHAVEHPAGLILTASVEGRFEHRLAGREPTPLHVSKELMRFEGGRLGDFVRDFNEFSDYLGEVLRAIGRLQDLLSAGAPEMPLDMTPSQKRALRPTDNTRETAPKKDAYREWRDHQARYARNVGGAGAGLVFDVTQARRDFDERRQEFWLAHSALKRSLEKYKSTDKPTYEALELTLSDAVSLLGGGWGAAETGADVLLGAAKRREEYDKKMAEFEKALTSAAGEVRDNFEKLRLTQSGYWDTYRGLLNAMVDRDKARVESRQRAAILGQYLAPSGEKRHRVLSEIRMPVYVADAWHALAVIGPPAREKLLKALSKRDVVARAAFHYRRGNDTGLEDIHLIIKALKQADSWDPILTADEVKEWIAVDRLWQDVFTEFNK